MIAAVDNLDVKTEHRSYNLYESTDFVGSPGPETDAVWHSLLQNRYIRVSKAELLRNERTSVELPGGGYMAWIGVFHELHCVVRQHLLDSSRRENANHAYVNRTCFDSGNTKIITLTIQPGRIWKR